MTKRFFSTLILALAVFLSSAVPALAYQESVTSTDPANTAPASCPTCHGLESGAASPTVAPRSVPSTWTFDTEAGTDVGTRKGPHGGYTTGTQKCQICHSMHNASPIGNVLLPEETMAATCFTCHDGTGGSGVYGVILQRTGFDPTEASATASGGTAGGVHRVGRRYVGGSWNDFADPVDIPGGNSDGTTYTATFSGPSGTLTCVDCHSAHNANTVKPFVGDRKRSQYDTSTSIATNRLLKVKPTTSDTTVTVYGSAWCQTCHKGSHTTSVSTSHPVETDANVRNYSKVVRLSGVDTSVTAAGTGSLGGSNFGYVMPDANGASAGGHGGDKPICQQCHEDTRDVGGEFGQNDQFWVKSSQAYAAPLDGDTAGNPQFQNFPHETVNDGLLIETGDDLCANCHYMNP